MVLGEKQCIRISVRNLVEFVFRSGDLDNRRASGAEKEAMQAGGRIHRKIQRRMGANYQAEVTMKHLVDEEEYQIAVEGRADGVITEVTNAVTIDEIKGVYMDLDHLTEAIPIHLAQAMCYGYIYCFDHGLHEITIQVTYCNMETEDIRRFQVDRSFEELTVWFDGLIHEYIKWAEYLCQHNLRRTESLKNLEFPFPYREGQKELAISAYRSIVRGKNLFIQAPTGVGKTISTIYPGLKAMGEGYTDKLFYLTAKTITRSVAEETYSILRNHGMYLRTVTITAKEKLCFLDQPECNPDACPYAKGHFDRVNDAVYHIIHLEFGITRDKVLAYAREHQVCPFEFCLDISNWVDGIICDYNYVFDPNVRLKRYFSEGVTGNYLFLVDEAHNLVSRARQMYSAHVFKEDFLLVKKLIKGRSQKLAASSERCSRMLLEMKREAVGYQIREGINHFVTALMTLFGELEKFMDENREFQDRDQVLDFYFEVRNFLDIFDRVDDHYRIYTELLGDGRFMLKLFCINPSKNLSECLEKGQSTLFFSATLLPVLYYKELLSGNLEDYAVYVHSPFPRENRLLMVASDVSSKYTRRNRREYGKVVSYIKEVVRGRTGNYMVFFPSFQYMREVELLLEELPEGERTFGWISQETHMGEEAREEFLAEFGREQNQSMVALCVMGGVFSEGIDLKKEQLIGAVIVGTGLPMVCTQQEILKNYFTEKEKQGFDYAYQYPGMNKVMQAAGRVIRTMEDKGIILLLDERFLQADYQALFPREWKEYLVVNEHTVGAAARSFWDGSRN